MKTTEIIEGNALTSLDVHQGVFSYEYDGKTIDIKGELYYNKKEHRFEHWHDEAMTILVVWPYEF